MGRTKIERERRFRLVRNVPPLYLNIDTGGPSRVAGPRHTAESLRPDGSWEHANLERFYSTMMMQVEPDEFRKGVSFWLLEIVNGDEAAVKKALESVGLKP